MLAASRAISVRLATCSLLYTCTRCVFTVPRLMNRRGDVPFVIASTRSGRAVSAATDWSLTDMATAESGAICVIYDRVRTS